MRSTVILKVVDVVWSNRQHNKHIAIRGWEIQAIEMIVKAIQPTIYVHAIT